MNTFHDLTYNKRSKLDSHNNSADMSKFDSQQPCGFCFVLPNEIFFHAATFLDVTDLMSLEQVNSNLNKIVEPLWVTLLSSIARRHLAYKTKCVNFRATTKISNLNNSALNAKQYCKYIHRKRTIPQFIIVGGTFGDNNEQLCAFSHDISTDSLIGGPIPKPLSILSQKHGNDNDDEYFNLPIHGLGSTSVVLNKYGYLTMLGGWDSINEVALDEAFRIDIYSYFKQFTAPYDTDSSMFALQSVYQAEEYNDEVQLQSQTRSAYSYISNYYAYGHSLEYENYSESDMCNTWYQTVLPSSLCFSSTVMLTTGELVCSGGCDCPYKGSLVYDDFYLLHDPGNNLCLNAECITDRFYKQLPDLPTKRCGHSTVVTYDNQLVLYGGYSGGNDYCKTGFLFDFTKQVYLPLPDMSVKRSGLICVLDGHGSIIVCGGSPDGLGCHKSVERLDLRMKKFENLSDMNVQRGYTAGCIGLNNNIYAFGGLFDDELLSPTAEYYEPRVNKWINLNCNHPTSHIYNTDSHMHLTDSSNKTSSSSKNVGEHLARACHQVTYLL